MILKRGARATLRRIESMRRTAIPALSAAGAEVYKIEADNLYAFFENPRNALEGALDAHRALRRLGSSGPKIAIGIGFGKLLYVPAEDEYYGAEFNLASKLGEDIGSGGETLLTEGLARRLEPGELTLRKRTVTVSGVKFAYYRVG